MFVKVSEAGLRPVACGDRPAIAMRFEPERPGLQRWTWNSVELAANVRVGERLSGTSELDVALIPAGSYWLDRSRVGALRRARCGDATHVVAVLRVGQIEGVDGPLSGYEIRPDSTAAPAECRTPWLVELVALDPHATPGPVCPAETAWTGRDCRPPHRENLGWDPPFCAPDQYDPGDACDPGWPATTPWIDAPIGLPARLDDDELARTLKPIAPRLLAYVPGSVELELEIAGAVGKMARAELAGPTTNEQVECMVEVLAGARFATFAQERQLLHWRRTNP